MHGVLVVDWREKTVSNAESDPAASRRMVDAQAKNREVVLSVSGVPASSVPPEEQE